MKGLTKKKLLHSPIFQALTLPVSGFPVPHETRPIPEPMLKLPALPVEEQIADHPKISGDSAVKPKPDEIRPILEDILEIPALPVEEKISNGSGTTAIPDLRNISVSDVGDSVRVPVAEALADFFQKQSR